MSATSTPSPPPTPPTSDSESESPLERPLTENPFACHTISCKPTSTPSPHPFAASTKANRAPPAYEKKLFTPPTTPPKLTTPSRRGQKFEVVTVRPTAHQSPSPIEDEKTRWDAAIASAVDKAETKIDLSSANLTYIPPSVIDLKDLVILAKPAVVAPPRTFRRSTTAPALLPSPHVPTTRRFLPSQTTNRLTFGAMRLHFVNEPKQATDCTRGEVELYLMQNTIRTLPREIFALDRLVVLSLRHNKLVSLPPAIGQLSGLRELNIAGNRLTHLPSEIQKLQLTSLQLYPNPFTPPPPPPSKSLTRVKSILNRVLGPIKHDASIPPLSEVMLRYLLTPIPIFSSNASSFPWQTRLETQLTLSEIDALPLPAHIKRVIRASTGHSRARVEEEGIQVDADLDISRSVCPCPRHFDLSRNMHYRKTVRFRPERDLRSKQMGYDAPPPVFGAPAEKRMMWVGVVAGVQVAESLSALVPLLWRGCSRGCLEFLDDQDDQVEEQASEGVFESGSGGEGEEFEFSEEE
ncbi:hypothetical protein K439DRAFT_1637480 [Ramaria rubella]|nr:hypothetical protein K439DRAFT_1637480 [Ramaria rubella]